VSAFRNAALDRGDERALAVLLEPPHGPVRDQEREGVEGLGVEQAVEVANDLALEAECGEAFGAPGRDALGVVPCPAAGEDPGSCCALRVHRRPV
jgi:hypothetical protein